MNTAIDSLKINIYTLDSEISTIVIKFFGTFRGAKLIKNIFINMLKSYYTHFIYKNSLRMKKLELI